MTILPAHIGAHLFALALGRSLSAPKLGTVTEHLELQLGDFVEHVVFFVSLQQVLRQDIFHFL